MRFKGTILLALVLILLGGYVLWIEVPGEKKKAESEERAKRLLDVQDEKITGLVIQDGETLTELERHPDRPDQKWEVIRPIVGPANDSAASFALSEIERLSFSRVVEEKPQDLKTFGLDPPDFSLTVVLNRTEVEKVDFGGTNPSGNELYAKRRGENRVVLVPSGVKFTLDKKLSDWRRKQILNDRPINVNELGLTYSDRTFSLSRQGEEWEIKKPRELRGDMAAVNGFLASLFNLQAEDFIDQKKEEKKASFGNPYLVVDLKIHEARRKVSFYKPASDPGALFAVTTQEDPIYKIRATDVDFLAKDLFALRDKSLVRLASQGDVNEIEVDREGSAYNLVRKEGKWTLADGSAVDEPKVNHLLVVLQTTQVDQFLEGAAAQPIKAGRIRVILRDKEKKSLGEVSFGDEEKGKILGESSAQATPFLVKKEVLDAVPKMDDLIKKPEAPSPPVGK